MDPRTHQLIDEEGKFSAMFRTFSEKYQPIAGGLPIFVVSVLGLQQVGKSTLLNMLFGKNFHAEIDATGDKMTQGIWIDHIKCPNYLLVLLDVEGIGDETPNINEKTREFHNILFAFYCSNVILWITRQESLFSGHGSPTAFFRRLLGAVHEDRERLFPPKPRLLLTIVRSHVKPDVKIDAWTCHIQRSFATIWREAKRPLAPGEQKMYSRDSMPTMGPVGRQAQGKDSPLTAEERDLFAEVRSLFELRVMQMGELDGDDIADGAWRVSITGHQPPCPHAGKPPVGQELFNRIAKSFFDKKDPLYIPAALHRQRPVGTGETKPREFWEWLRAAPEYFVKTQKHFELEERIITAREGALAHAKSAHAALAASFGTRITLRTRLWEWWWTVGEECWAMFEDTAKTCGEIRLIVEGHRAKLTEALFALSTAVKELQQTVIASALLRVAELVMQAALGVELPSGPAGVNAALIEASEQYRGILTEKKIACALNDSAERRVFPTPVPRGPYDLGGVSELYFVVDGSKVKMMMRQTPAEGPKEVVPDDTFIAGVMDRAGTLDGAVNILRNVSAITSRFYRYILFFCAPYPDPAPAALIHVPRRVFPPSRASQLPRTAAAAAAAPAARGPMPLIIPRRNALDLFTDPIERSPDRSPPPKVAEIIEHSATQLLEAIIEVQMEKVRKTQRYFIDRLFRTFFEPLPRKEIDLVLADVEDGPAVAKGSPLSNTVIADRLRTTIVSHYPNVRRLHNCTNVSSVWHILRSLLIDQFQLQYPPLFVAAAWKALLGAVEVDGLKYLLHTLERLFTPSTIETLLREVTEVCLAHDWAGEPRTKGPKDDPDVVRNHVVNERNHMTIHTQFFWTETIDDNVSPLPVPGAQVARKRNVLFHIIPKNDLKRASDAVTEKDQEDLQTFVENFKEFLEEGKADSSALTYKVGEFFGKIPFGLTKRFGHYLKSKAPILWEKRPTPRGKGNEQPGIRVHSIQLPVVPKPQDIIHVEEWDPKYP